LRAGQLELTLSEAERNIYPDPDWFVDLAGAVQTAAVERDEATLENVGDYDEAISCWMQGSVLAGNWQVTNNGLTILTRLPPSPNRPVLGANDVRSLGDGRMWEGDFEETFPCVRLPSVLDISWGALLRG
jgi:hypothetical protein